MKNGLITAGEQLLSRAARALEHHPKHITALVAALLLGIGGAAFALASAGPDPSTMAVREVLEAVEPLPLKEQSAALEALDFKLYRSDFTHSNDTVEALLSRLGVADPAAAAFLRSDAGFRSQVLGRAGRAVAAEAGESNSLEKLSVRWANGDDGTFNRLVVEHPAQGKFTSRTETAPLIPSVRLGGGIVRTSLFAAVDDARIPDSVARQLIDIFSGDIDFHRALRRGDRFGVVYEALEADGEPLRTGRVLSAEFVNGGKVYQAMWFQEPGQKGGYYSPDGKSLRGAYLASPMEFSRVTSGFAMRFHPILHQWKQHLGTDYGAPAGTPVRTVGDGVVEFAGVQNGFGNVVMVRHNGRDVTVYAHLSRINVTRGQRVSQGQNIGAVGMTGWATGPHLHFEFRVNGVFQNATRLARSDGTPVPAASMPAFRRMAGLTRVELATAATANQQFASAQ